MALLPNYDTFHNYLDSLDRHRGNSFLELLPRGKHKAMRSALLVIQQSALTHANYLASGHAFKKYPIQLRKPDRQ